MTFQRSPGRRAVTLCGALALLAASSAGASPVLAVSSLADAPALRAALAEGGVSVLTDAETASVLESAANSGVSCVITDVACWQAVASLAGHEQVVIATEAELVRSNPQGVTRVPRLEAGAGGLRGAVLRLLDRTGGVVVRVVPANAGVTVNGAPLQGGVMDVLAPGKVTVTATAQGFNSRTDDVEVVAGEIARIEWALAAAEPSAPAPSSLSPVLLWGGLATVGVGAIAGGAIAGINFSANCSFSDASPSGMTCNDEGDGDHAGTRAVDIAAIAIGAGISTLGVGAAVASLFVE